MYIRFVICQPGVRPAEGILCGDFDSEEPQPEWLEALIDEHRVWFNKYLPVPRHFTARIPPRKIYRGLSWFRPEAHEFIARARELARLLEEAGAVTAQLKTRRPGQILYCDDFQVVARPGAETPHTP